MKISRSELSKKYNITNSQWQRRHDDLLEHINDFFSIEEIKEGRYYYYIIPDELPDSIPTLPRKSRAKEKIIDYENYVDKHLPKEFAPMSKAKMSRDAIKDFGKEKYKHNSPESVARVYVGPAMEKLGEKSDNAVWVDYKTYIPLDEEQFKYLKHCFSDNNLSEEDFAELGYDLVKTGVVPNEKLKSVKDKYENSITQFKLKYGIIPIRTRNWRKRIESAF